MTSSELHPRSERALAALRKTWGYDAFRLGQDEAVEAAMAGKDTLAVLPTGGGKSLIFQVPPVATESLTIVVSPLLALMRDQVDALARRGVSATMLHGGLSRLETDKILTNAEFGMYRLLYLTPERLETDLFRARAARLPAGWLAVDEAHCISEWGHDFRPAYRRIAAVREVLKTPVGGKVPLIAVTATATPEVRRDIIDQLGLDDPAVLVRGFDRPNIAWSVYHEDNKQRRVTALFHRTPGAGLIYAGTRRGTEDWAATLRDAGISAEAYHAGLPSRTRDDVQRRWLGNETRVIAATSAFGMGIDKPDVRQVVHVALPPTLESYYQEAGRAGRDGEPSFAALVVGAGDDQLPRSLAESGHPTPKLAQAVYEAVGSVSQIAIGSLPDGPMSVDVATVATVVKTTESSVRTTITRLAQFGAWSVLPDWGDRNEITIRVPGGPERILQVGRGGNKALAAFSTSLVRALDAAVYSDWTQVRLGQVARTLSFPVERLEAAFSFLQERGAVEIAAAGGSVRIEWLEARRKRAPIDAAALKRSRDRSLSNVQAMVDYVDTAGCRRRHLLAFFGESSPPACGACDRCVARESARVAPADEEALAALLRHVDRGRSVGVSESTAREEQLIDWLLQAGHLEIEDVHAGQLRLTDSGRRFL